MVRDQPVGLCPYWAQIFKHTALNSRPDICILIALPPIHGITAHLTDSLPHHALSSILGRVGEVLMGKNLKAASCGLRQGAPFPIVKVMSGARH